MPYYFPFGQELHPLVQEDQSPKKVFVLGVYASAVHARWKKDGQIIGKERQQVYDAGHRKDVFTYRTEFRQVWKYRGSCPHAKYIIYCEKGDGDSFDRQQQTAILQFHPVKGIENGYRQIEQKHQTVENVIAAADPVIARTHLDDGCHSFAALDP